MNGGRGIVAAEGPPDSYTVFVDETESDRKRPGMGHLYGYGAVAVPTWWLPHLTARLETIRADFGIPESEELKWSPKRSQQPVQHQLGFQGRRPLQEQLLEAARAAFGFSVVVAWDSGRDSRPETDRDAMMLAMLFERISYGVRECRAIATVIFDHKFDRMAPEADRLAQQWSQVKEGTSFVSSGAVAVPYLSASSAHQPGLQLADLIAGATLSAVAGRAAGQDLITPLLSLARKSPYDGSVGKYGIKVFPDEVVGTSLRRWLPQPPASGSP